MGLCAASVACESRSTVFAQPALPVLGPYSVCSRLRTHWPDLLLQSEHLSAFKAAVAIAIEEYFDSEDIDELRR